MRNLLVTAAMFALSAAPALAQNAAPTSMSVNLTSTGFQAAATINAGIIGAGVNGPGHAQVGMAINMNKANWWDKKAAVGEEDGVYSTIFQGGPNSDTSAYLGQITATGLGFASVMEGTVTIQPPITSGNGVVDAMLDVQIGVINVGNQIYGSNYNLALKPSNGVAVGYSLNGNGWNYLAQWWNGSTDEFHVDGAGNVKAAGAVQPGVFATARLPMNCTAGQQLYATDGRKANESAGQGSGVPVICTATRRNYPTAWFSMWSGATVVD